MGGWLSGKNIQQILKLFNKGTFMDKYANNRS